MKSYRITLNSNKASIKDNTVVINAFNISEALWVFLKYRYPKLWRLERNAKDESWEITLSIKLEQEQRKVIEEKILGETIEEAKLMEESK